MRDVAEVRRATGPVEIAREDQVKQVIVGRIRRLASASAMPLRARKPRQRASRARRASTLPWADRQMMAENRRALAMILAFAAFFAFAVLAIQFESFRLPIIIFLSLPVCMAGMIYGLLLGGREVTCYNP